MKQDLKIDKWTVIHCKTEKLANKVLTIADNLGHKWGDNTSYKKTNMYEVYENNTVYDLHLGLYDHVNATTEDYKIMLAEEFIKLHDKFFDLTTLAIGTKVWCPLYDEGVIQNVDSYSYPITVKFNTGYIIKYNKEGRYDKETNITLSPSKEAYFANPEDPWYDYSLSIIPDKSLVWCWDNDRTHLRVLTFYDAINKKVYSGLGKRNVHQYEYDNYELYEGEYPDWAKKAVKHLKD